ncbi:hypothetical protein C6P45_000448 [Maudiozyma exigua]|uniref:Uncharacterized protein n=1 Tax=Maudiozyma exigua TaxID=34358 RepID=A0A9P6W6P8_MAUEX|nr:hypothetical protein C6P45_000448 [Kazachstania exigua]
MFTIFKSLFNKKVSFNLIYLTTGFTLPFVISAYSSQRIEYNRIHNINNATLKASHRPRNFI